MTIIELFTDPARYTKGAMARDAMGMETDPESAEAVSWCLLGAINHCYPDLHSRNTAYKKLVLALREKKNTESVSIVEFNDGWKTKAADVKYLAEQARV